MSENKVFDIPEFFRQRAWIKPDDYAEMYRRLGLADLGATLSCQRDRAFIEGFNPRLRLERTQTLMEGGACCDFRYRRQAEEP